MIEDPCDGPAWNSADVAGKGPNLLEREASLVTHFPGGAPRRYPDVLFA